MDGPREFRDEPLRGALLSEEWEHRLFAERDLEVLEARLDG